MLRRTFLVAACAVALAGSGLGVIPALAQEDYPTRPVEFIVPWSPGGGSDTLMRIVAAGMEDQLGQPVPVINMPGASGTTGLREATRRQSDGYTMAQIHDGLVVAHHLGLTELNWDDFIPVGQITSSPQFLVVNADSPWNTIEEFLQYAEENPGQVRVGVTLAGVPHLHAAMIEESAGVEFGYVGYEGTGERIRGLLGGTVQAAIGDIASAFEFVRNGDLRFLAVGSDERLPQAPDVPTFKEMGHDLELTVTRGIVVPEGTPQENIDTLEQALAAMAEDEQVVRQLRNSGAEVVFRDQESYTQALQRLDETVQRLSSRIES
ncbi:MAG TPA: tripartite tricarboxylate transporter substrate binding protein [Arenibaculum sp.]|nr:tripartite tricarboxylate transporter substrate binding protein [Arenibaculum sp.]